MPYEQVAPAYPSPPLTLHCSDTNVLLQVVYSCALALPTATASSAFRAASTFTSRKRHMSNDHKIQYSVWQGYNSTRKWFDVRTCSCYFACWRCSRLCDRFASYQAWTAETNRSFLFQTATIEGRQVDYPVLIDSNGEAMLVQHTNDFLIWFCAHADIVTKKTVVEKALSWLKACADMARAKINKIVLERGVFSSHMPVQVAINDHTKAAGSSSIAGSANVQLSTTWSNTFV